MFTPLQLWSYSADLAVFGRNPIAFYAHQLASVSLAALALGAMLRTWLRPLESWTAAGLFVLGVPSSDWALQLMFRHYVEGLLCASLAVWFFRRATRRERWTTAAVVSAFFYLLAMLAKEIYVPLIALLLALPEGSGSRRLRSLVPHGAALLLYLVWRWAMLGTLLGGYGWATRIEEMPRLLAAIPARLAVASSGGAGWAVLPVLFLLLAGVAVLLRRRPSAAFLLAVSAVLIAGPIFPVAKSINERFGTLPWILLTAAFVFGCRELAATSSAGRWASGALILATFVAALVANRLDWRVRYAGAQRESAEGRFFLLMEPGDLLRHPRVPPAAMKETRWLKEESLRLPRGAGWFADDIYLCGGWPNGRIWGYDEGEGRMRDVTRAASAAAARYCASLRAAPLAARFESSRGSFFWILGPYPRGQYALVFDRGVEAVPVDRDGGYQASPDALTLMVRYRSPQGWVTYSPQLTMDFRAASRYRWERPASVP